MVTAREQITSHVGFSCRHFARLRVLQECVTIVQHTFTKHTGVNMKPKSTPDRDNGRTRRSRKPCLKSLLRSAARQVILHAPPLTIGLITGLSIGLVGGFLIAWILCLRLLSILVLIPLGPGGW